VYLYVTQLPHRRRLVQIAIGLILGGALGNVVDRVRLGFVVDFIQVGWFPIFNLADSSITVGAALLMLQYALDEIAWRRTRQAMISQ
jgi:signal peptidase II